MIRCLLLLLTLCGSLHAWRIEGIRSKHQNGVYRVSCVIAGKKIWYESTSPLNGSAEAFASLLILPALSRQETIYIDEPVDRKWYNNIQKLIPVYCEWFGYLPRNPLIIKSYKKPAKGPKSFGSCFSCGVDSFYTLLCEGYPIDTLVYVQGFDCLLSDSAKIAEVTKAVEDVCSRLNKKPLIIRTNVRDHPLVQSLEWGYFMHGAVLASIAHIAGSVLDHLVIPSSNRPGVSEIRGSHWRTDPLYSSSTMQIVHTLKSELVSRPIKTASIAHYPIVQEKLRVCWEGAGAIWNCSRCEKCIRTMVDLCACQSLKRFDRLFDLSVPLVNRIDALQWVDRSAILCIESSLQQPLPPDVEQALRRLIARSQGLTMVETNCPF